MDETQRRIDEVRRESTELENHLIDEYVSGRITRRELVRRGTVVGMSLPALSFIAAACGGDDDDDGGAQTGGAETTAGAVQPGGTIRVALIQPTTEPNPLLVQDEGGAGMLGATGEYLSFSDENLALQPRIAESWEPNEDGSVWTFTIRSGVTFHNGQALTSEDVVTTFDKLINPDGGSANAQSALGGVLSAGNIEAPDDTTVVFNLDAPNGNFPTLVSSANYNAIIIPADLDPADWGQTFEGTGPFKLQSFTPQQGATFVRNDAYWGDKANPDTVEVRFYAEEAPMIVALQGDEVDFLEHFSVAGGAALLDNPDVQVIGISTATHRQLHMRTDKEPFTDNRVRQAIALAIDRNALVDGLWEGRAEIGNDSPFAPLYPSTDPSVPQREQDIEQAKQLLADAGAEGFTVQLDTWDGFEIPDLAQLVKNAAAEIGVTINLKITDAAHVLRRRRLREVDLARLGDGHHRLRPPAGAERLSDRRARGRSQARGLELGALQERRLRRARATVCRRARRRFSADGRQADPGAPARGDSDHLPVLLQLPQRCEADPSGSGVRGDGPVRPLQGRFHGLSRRTIVRRPGPPGSGRRSV